METEQIKLFDYEEPPKMPPKMIFKSKYQKWKWEHKYKKAEKISNIRCKNCKHLISKLAICPSEKNYYKCELLGCSSAAATDIRLGYVCDNFIRRNNAKQI